MRDVKKIRQGREIKREGNMKEKKMRGKENFLSNENTKQTFARF